MAWIKRNLLFVVGLAVAVALLGVGVFYLSGTMSDADAVNAELGKDGVRFYPGVSYRHLMVISGPEYAKTACTPPHDRPATKPKPANSAAADACRGPPP